MLLHRFYYFPVIVTLLCAEQENLRRYSDT